LNNTASTLSPDAADLLVQCARIIGNSANPDQQRGALDALNGEQLQAAQNASLNFGKLQAANVAARMSALRQGARGVSLAGLNFSYKGEPVPVAQISQAAKALGLNIGGSSGDEDAGDLKARKLGLFLNGKVGFGDRDTTQNETGYDFDSIGATLGADYRFRDDFVAGIAVGYSHAKADFDFDSGGLKSKALSGTVFSTWYAGPAYIDMLATFGSVTYDSKRHIQYNVGSTGLDRTALGDTDGTMITLGLGGGYDITAGGWVFTPNASVTYMKVKVDGFTETGAQGLDLEYGEQDAHSTQFQGGLQVAYNYSAKWGVLSPQLYGSFVRDNQTLDAILLRFASDPFTSNPNQPGSGTVFFATGDEPDKQYFRWGGSLAAAFGRGISAFVNYESFAGLRATSYSEITFGVRMQRVW
jgi:outer membrane autotransporter protein